MDHLAALPLQVKAQELVRNFVGGKRVPQLIDVVKTYHAVLHNVSGPAIRKTNGEEMWYRMGVLHRDDGPAKITADGQAMWYRNGERVEPPPGWVAPALRPTPVRAARKPNVPAAPVERRPQPPVQPQQRVGRRRRAVAAQPVPQPRPQTAPAPSTAGGFRANRQPRQRRRMPGVVVFRGSEPTVTPLDRVEQTTASNGPRARRADRHAPAPRAPTQTARPTQRVPVQTAPAQNARPTRPGLARHMRCTSS